MSALEVERLAEYVHNTNILYKYIIILDRYDDLRWTLANIIRLARLRTVDSLGKVFYLIEDMGCCPFPYNDGL